MARLADRAFDALRDRRAFEAASMPATTADLESLRGHRYLLLITFDRNGRPVPSPVWFALDGDAVYVKTAAHAGKVKRLRNDDRVRVAPSTSRGSPRGPSIEMTGRLLSPADWELAERALERAYGIARRLSEATMARLADAAYIELRPRPES